MAGVDTSGVTVLTAKGSLLPLASSKLARLSSICNIDGSSSFRSSCCASAISSCDMDSSRALFSRSIFCRSSAAGSLLLETTVPWESEDWSLGPGAFEPAADWRCCLKADGLFRFLCSGKPVLPGVRVGRDGALTLLTSFSLTSKIRSILSSCSMQFAFAVVQFCEKITRSCRRKGYSEIRSGLVYSDVDFTTLACYHK